MIIDCISDLHGHYPALSGGDLLIVAGDLTERDENHEHEDFCDWLDVQGYAYKIVIAGNHDNLIDPDLIDCLRNTSYLCDCGVEFEGLKIWGSPWTKKFQGMNPKYMAFTVDTEKELAQKWRLIPNDADILVTHGPPYGIRDRVYRYTSTSRKRSEEHFGSMSLQVELFTRLKPKLFVCGHVHEAYGQEPPGGFLERAVNASHVNEFCDPVNEPIRIEL